MIKAASTKTKKIVAAAVAAAMVATAVPAVALVSAAADTTIGIETAYAETTVEKLARMADSAASQTPYAATLAKDKVPGWDGTSKVKVLSNSDFTYEGANPEKLYSDGTDESGNFSAASGKTLAEAVKGCSGVTKEGVRWAFIGGKVADDNDGWGPYPVKGYGTFYFDCDGAYDPTHNGEYGVGKEGAGEVMVCKDYGAVNFFGIAKTVIIGKHVTELGNFSMQHAEDYQTLTYESPSSLAKINPETFLYSYFKEIQLPKTVTKIPEKAFSTIPNTKVTFESPAEVEVPSNAFDNAWSSSKPNVNAKKTGKVTKLTAGKRTLKVTMKKVSGAKSYRIYYKTTTAKKYKSKLVKPTTKNSTSSSVTYTLKKVTKGKKYKVYYIAYSKSSGSKSSAITKTTAKTSPKIK